MSSSLSLSRVHPLCDLMHFMAWLGRIKTATVMGTAVLLLAGCGGESGLVRHEAAERTPVQAGAEDAGSGLVGDAPTASPTLESPRDSAVPGTQSDDLRASFMSHVGLEGYQARIDLRVGIPEMETSRLNSPPGKLEVRTLSDQAALSIVNQEPDRRLPLGVLSNVRLWPAWNASWGTGLADSEACALRVSTGVDVWCGVGYLQMHSPHLEGVVLEPEKEIAFETSVEGGWTSLPERGFTDFMRFAFEDPKPSRDEALDRLIRASVTQSSDQRFDAVVAVRGDDPATGSLMLLLLDGTGGVHAGDSKGMSELDSSQVAVSETGRIVEAQGFTILTLLQANDRSAEVDQLVVPAPELGENVEIRMLTPSQAGAVEPTKVWDSRTGTLTDTRDGSVYVSAGTRLVPMAGNGPALLPAWDNLGLPDAWIVTGLPDPSACVVEGEPVSAVIEITGRALMTNRDGC